MELLPCPFCGDEALPTAHLTYNWFAPVCRRCNARGPSVKIERDSDPQEMRNLMNQADENWNRRASPASAPEDVIDAVTIALRKAFQLEQTYWQQADSDYISQNKKSDDTYAKFLVLSEEISALLAAAPTPPVQGDLKDAERFRFLLEDHPERETRVRLRELFSRLPVMSQSAARLEIDAAMEGK